MTPVKNTFKKEKQHIRQSAGDNCENDNASNPDTPKSDKSAPCSPRETFVKRKAIFNDIISYFQSFSNIKDYEDFKKLVKQMINRSSILDNIFISDEKSISHLLSHSDARPIIIPVFLYLNFFKVNENWNKGMNENHLFQNVEHDDILPIADEDTFKNNFSAYSDNLFNSLEWSNLCVIGDSVYNCLIHIKDDEKDESFNLNNYYFNKYENPIDFYFYGCKNDRLKQRILYLINHIISIQKSRHALYSIVASNSVISILSDTYRRINIICKSYI